MGLQIEDGQGSGKLVAVDARNRIRTLATTENQISYISERTAQSYTIYGKRDFTAAQTDQDILHIQYTGETSLHISTVVFATNSTRAKVECFVGSSYTAGGTAVTPINLNQGSGNTLSATCYNGITPLTASAGTKEVVDVRINAGTVIMDFKDALILKKNNTFFMKGEVSASAEKIRVTVACFEDADD